MEMEWEFHYFFIVTMQLDLLRTAEFSCSYNST